MQSSPELRALVEQAFQQLAAKNVTAFMTLFSRDPDTLFIGTAPNEWINNATDLETMIRATAEASSGNMPPDLQIQAWQEGALGWAAFRYTARLPNDTIILFRGTSVLHQEGGAWKVVQQHVSVAVPDELVPNIAQPAP